MINIIFLLIISIILSFFLILIFSKLFYKLNILDNPIKYKKNRQPIPYSIGITFFISFFILSYFSIEMNYKLYLIYTFSGIITIISFIDDLFNIAPKIRLFVQIIIGSIIGLTAIKIGYVSNIFGGIIELESFFIEIFGYKIYLVSFLFTIIWYVFIFNSLNWTDGIEGNTSGLSIISFLVIFLLGFKLYFQDDYIGGKENAKMIMSISIILIGTLIPYWFFDVKQKALMGDSGTMFLGFMLASLAIIAGGKVATVLVVFGIYAIDTVYVILKRIKNKKNILYGDFTHLHHRLLDIGMTKNQILIFIFSFSFLFGCSSLFLDKIGKIVVFIIIIFFVIFSPKIIVKIFKKN